MYKGLLIIAAMAVSGLGTGCATLSGDTLLSELRNDHQPGTTVPSSPAMQVGQSRMIEAVAAGPGASCHFGSDCRSGACEHSACMDLGGETGTSRQVQVAVDP